MRFPRMAIDAHRGARRINLQASLGDRGDRAPLDAALVLTATGQVLSIWARGQTRSEVLGIMSATMVASVETFMEELRGHRPDRFLVETGDQRLLAKRTRGDRILVLSAPSTVPPASLLASAAAMEDKLAAPHKTRKRESHALVVRP